jgi:hypothetical protein
MHFVEIETTVGCASYGEVAVVNRVKGAAEERDATGVMFGGGALRLRSGQYASQEVTVTDFLTNS